MFSFSLAHVKVSSRLSSRSGPIAVAANHRNTSDAHFQSVPVTHKQIFTLFLSIRRAKSISTSHQSWPQFGPMGRGMVSAVSKTNLAHRIYVPKCCNGGRGGTTLFSVANHLRRNNLFYVSHLRICAKKQLGDY